jgi:molecular chaperone IbpA
MTKITSFDLAPFYRNSVGVDRLFDRIVSQFEQTTSSSNNYPPYNIVKTGDNTFEIQVAVAGFGQGDIEVNFHEGQLTITGEKTAEPDANIVYQHQGISARKFVRSFSLADYVEVLDAVARDGILVIRLERVVPEAMKPKSIAITYTN